jgi:hypothetical protein
MKGRAKACLHLRDRDQAGSVSILVATSMLMLFGFVAISIDVSYLTRIQSNLQASANMAAMAGARGFSSGTASASAISYGGQTGSMNAFALQNVTTAVALKCLTTVANLANGSIPCLTYGSQPASNAVQVTQTVTVPTFFAGVFGISNVTLKAVATAIPEGAGPAPMNVVFVVDTTASMNDADTSCQGTSKTTPSRLDCALNGLQILLGQLWPSVDQASLMVFPGLTSTSQAPLDYNCSSSPSPQTAAYNANPVYEIISASTNYRTGTPPAAGLNTSSNLAKAVGGGGSSCASLKAVGGFGTYYADVITAAQSALVATKQAGQQNVMVILTDGDANASASHVGTGKALNQCHQGITAAQAATNAGTWVYAIAYGSSTSSSSSCTTDTPPISACSALQQTASDPAKFFSDAPAVCVSVNAQSQLSDIFSRIAGTFSSARLIPNGTS